MNSSIAHRNALASAQDLRARLSLPDLMGRLGYGENNKRSAKCPFHEDQHASFSVYETSGGYRWKCHAGCGGGDEVDFLCHASQSNKAAAFDRWRELAAATPSTAIVRHSDEAFRNRMSLPSDFHSGSDEELSRVAGLRCVSRRSVTEMRERKVLGFGTVCGFACWIVTDPSHLCAEARRIDGQPFPPFVGLGSRKVHTIRGSIKSWPVGLGVDDAAICNRLLILEGSGDLLAGYHFAMEPFEWLPIAILGASVRCLHPEALRMMRGKKVRVVPHVDSAGFEFLESICHQLDRAGCSSIDWIDMRGWRRADSSPVKDLNDCVGLYPSDQRRLEGLLK
jgi:hypothetical protein